MAVCNLLILKRLGNHLRPPLRRGTRGAGLHESEKLNFIQVNGDSKATASEHINRRGNDAGPEGTFAKREHSITRIVFSHTRNRTEYNCFILWILETK